MKSYSKVNFAHLFVTFILYNLATVPVYGAQKKNDTLEEVIVTAQKRAESLQDTPIAISVLGEHDLNVQGITSLDDLSGGAVPSLRVMPVASNPSTLFVSIRGNGPTDVGQITREGSVAIYLDGVYMGRAQGLSADVADLERVEVLRGPQGTLFGRNATGGAVSLISKKPTGELDFEQTLGAGNYGAWHSGTHINLPDFAGVSAKLDYLHSQRDGWVNNSASGAPDYNEYEKDGGRLSVNWQISDTVAADYTYDNSRVETTQMYFQVYAPVGFIAAEPDRQTRTRFPIDSLEPSVVDQQAHALTANWEISEELTFKSITSYRELEEETSNNWAGALAFFGLIFNEEIDQIQRSQEFQLLYSGPNLTGVTGLYYYRETASEDTRQRFSLDTNGFLTGTPLTPINPPIPLGFIPDAFVDNEARSEAIYGQLTATFGKASITGGFRYSNDNRSGERVQVLSTPPFSVVLFPPSPPFDIDDQDHLDGSLTFNYDWHEDFSTYIKYGTAYKAGGIGLRSVNFLPFDKEVAKTWEAGAKTEFWDRRIRLNIAVFDSKYKDMQIDVANPTAVGVVETINALKTVKVSGAEIDLAAIPFPGLTLGLSYTYLDGDMPLQPNPLESNTLEDFETTQTPQHAGSLSADYVFASWNFGTLAAHMDITSTDRYSYVAFKPALQRFDAYTLFNARVTLSNLTLGAKAGSLEISIWGKNLTDEDYIIASFPTVQAFGNPRTAGVDFTFAF